jgi:hypothetical protein
MQTDAARQAKSPFPGMVKEASVYVKPESLIARIHFPLSVAVTARMKTKTVDHVDLYLNDELLCQMTEAPYQTEFTPSKTGKFTLKAIVTTTDGSTYERLSAIQVKRGTAISTPSVDESSDRKAAYDLYGRKVGDGYRGIIVKEGKKILMK